MASVVQKFDLELADPGYNLEIKQALTVKPDEGFKIRARVREGVKSVGLEKKGDEGEEGKKVGASGEKGEGKRERK